MKAMTPTDLLAKQAGYTSYRAYLGSEHWLLFSTSIKGKQCYCCGKSKYLQVHHVTYERLGREWPTDVITACDSCHVQIHKLANAGVPLNEAHDERRRQARKDRSTKTGIDNKWVEWTELRNKSRHQTTAQLEQDLTSWGFLENGSATAKAYRMGIVRRNDRNRERWSLRRYIRIMKNCNKRSKSRPVKALSRPRPTPQTTDPPPQDSAASHH